MAANQVPTGKTQTFTADGSGDWVAVTGPAWVSIANDIGGGTATIQYKDMDGSARAIAGEVWQAVKDRIIDFPAGAENEIRVTLASATSPDLDVVIQSSSPYSRGPGRSIGTDVT